MAVNLPWETVSHMNGRGESFTVCSRLGSPQINKQAINPLPFSQV